jgi:hypothetical protein
MPVPRTLIDPYESRKEQPGLAWLGWEPHLSGAWRMWRTGDRPLEFDGRALTPRFTDYDEVPPLDRFADICRQVDHVVPDHCSFYLNWPDYDVVREEMALTCDGQDFDAVVVRSDGGQYVLGWTEQAVGVADPPPGEVRERYPFPTEPRPTTYGFVFDHLEYRGGVRFRTGVFDTAAELRTWVESSGEGRLSTTSTKLVRWIVDLASEFDRSLDVAATAERLPGPGGAASTSSPKGSTCSVCGESRPLLDFYDDVHTVWMLNDEPWIHIDHGEAAALVPPRDTEVRRQAEVLADRLARAGGSYEWLSVFDLDVEERCCAASDHWTYAQHIVDHQPPTLIEIAASSDMWAVTPHVQAPDSSLNLPVHERLQAELARRRYAINDRSKIWEERHFDDPSECASDLLALLEGAGIVRPLIVHRAQPNMGEVLETILPV